MNNNLLIKNRIKFLSLITFSALNEQFEPSTNYKENFSPVNDFFTSNGFISNNVGRMTFSTKEEENIDWKGNLFSTLLHLNSKNLVGRYEFNFDFTNRTKESIKRFLKFNSKYSDLDRKLKQKVSEIVIHKKDLMNLRKERDLMKEGSKKQRKIDGKIAQIEKIIKSIEPETLDLENQLLKEKESYKKIKDDINDFELENLDEKKQNIFLRLPYPLSEIIKEVKDERIIGQTMRLLDSFEKDTEFNEDIMITEKLYTKDDDLIDIDIDVEDKNFILGEQIKDQNALLLKHLELRKYANIGAYVDEVTKSNINLDKVYFSKDPNIVVLYGNNKKKVITIPIPNHIRRQDINKKEEAHELSMRESIVLHTFIDQEDEVDEFDQLCSYAIKALIKNYHSMFRKNQNTIAKKIYTRIVKEFDDGCYVLSDGHYFYSKWKPSANIPKIFPIGLNSENYSKEYVRKTFFVDKLTERQTRNQLMESIISETIEMDVGNKRFNQNAWYVNDIRQNKDKLKRMCKYIQSFGKLYAKSKRPYRTLRDGDTKNTSLNLTKANLQELKVIFKKPSGMDKEKESLSHDQITIGSVLNIFSDFFCYGYAQTQNNYEISVVIDDIPLPLLFYNKYASSLLKSFKNQTGQDYTEHFKTYMMWTRLTEIIGSVIAEVAKARSKKGKKFVPSTMKSMLDSKLELNSLTRFRSKNEIEEFKIDHLILLSKKFSSGTMFSRPNTLTKSKMIECILSGKSGSEETNWILEYVDNNY